jgi:hypothetical protein
MRLLWWVAATPANGRTGSAAITLGALTASAQATVVVSGTASPTLGALTTTATGAITVSSQGAIALGALVTSASGAVIVQASGSVTLGALTLSGRISSGQLAEVIDLLAQNAGPIAKLAQVH